MSLDSLTLAIIILSSIFGAIFTLFIPLYDQNSKRIISLFFSFIGLVFYARLLTMYLRHEPMPDIMLTFPIGATKMSFRLMIDDVNIFMFGAISLFLLINSLVVFDNSRHTSYFSVFLLSLFLFICIGQKNIRISLPLISISSFVVYYLMSFYGKERRGTTIFRMGVFLFSIECCALILLQHQEFAHTSQLTNVIYSLMIILPGLARLLLPICAPFTEFLLGNFDDRHAELTLVYLQMSGFFLIKNAKSELNQLSEDVLILLNIITIISLLFVVVCLVYKRLKKHNLYYGLIFFSGIAAVAFLTLSGVGEKIGVAIFITNLISFIILSTLNSYIEHLAKHKKYSESSKTSLWLVINILIMGLPGVGVGSSVAFLIYYVLDPASLTHLSASIVWISIFLGLIVALVLWMDAIIGSFGWPNPAYGEQEIRMIPWRTLKMPRSVVYLATIFIMLFSLIAPFVIVLRA